MLTARYALAVGLLLWLAAPTAHATVRLPSLVGSHMVLQRDKPLPVWGWAAPGETVRVTFRGQTYQAPAPDATGRWQVTLPATAAGGPYQLTVKGQNTLVLQDVLVGDVWLASGQSNMQMPVKDGPGGYPIVQNADQEVAAANFPNIRFYTVAQTVAYRPQAEVQGTGWQVCSPATVARLSAVAYFFGRDLYQRYHVPIGLLVSSWGGTPAEAWTSAEGLRAFPEFQAQIQDFAHRTTTPADDQRTFDTHMAEYRQALSSRDQGRSLGGQSWASPTYDAHAWPTMLLPAPWEETPGLSSYDGIIWFRKEIDLTAADVRQPLELDLGPIDDIDSTWVNGVPVGSTNVHNLPRAYPVLARAVHPGRNVIAVRVTDTGGGGGLYGKPDMLHLTTAARSLPLAGPWQYQVGIAPENLPKAPVGNSPNPPTDLYNGMIAPLVPFAIKGAIWYQGENNVPHAEQYRTLLPALITDWRRHWGYEFPFLFVQLANFLPAKSEPAESEWAELREAQAMTLSLPHTGMATAVDVGNPDDIHPTNKQEVGRRLALVARHVAYGDKAVVYSGPSYASLAITGGAARLTFTNLGGGLLAKDGELRGFAVAGADHQFHWATARIEGEQVVVQSTQVPAPVAVRYDWADNPAGNLYNKAGLPALPFRTDAWPELTAGRR